MKLSNSITIFERNDSQLKLEATQEAVAMRDEAVAASCLIGRVSNAVEQQEAVAAQVELQRILSLVEKAREQCKEPVLKFGRLIDAKAREFRQELEDEMLRVSKLIGDFQTLEQMKARASEQVRNQELQQIERDRQAALATVNSHEEADAVNEAFDNRVASQSPAPEPPRVAGQRLMNDWDITVTDIHSLYRSHSHCVKLTPLMSEIKNLLKLGVKINGVTATETVKAGVKLPATKVIEV